MDTAEASGLQPGSVIKVASILRAALALAVKRGTITRNPATAEHGLQLPTVAKSKLTPPTPGEVMRILDAASDPYRLPLTMLAWCGLRRSELLALRWRDLDLAVGELRVRQSLSFVGRELSFSEPKTERSFRTVPLSPALVSLLQEARREQAERRLRVGPSWRDHDLVIAGVDGSPWHPDRLSLYFTRLVGRLGMDCRLHDLRHAFVSTLLAQGVPVLDVSRIAGHASGGFTMDRYGHLQPGHGDGIRDAMTRAYAGGGA